MKKTIKGLTTITVVFLCGCATWLGPKFDPTEYQSFVDMETLTDLMYDTCGTNKQMASVMRHNILADLTLKTRIQVNYTKYVDPDVNKATVIFQKNLKEMSDRYDNDTDTPTTTYCSMKTTLLQLELEKILDSIGKRA